MSTTHAHADGGAGRSLGNHAEGASRGRLSWVVDAAPGSDGAQYARRLADQLATSAGANDLSLQAIARLAIADAVHPRTGPTDPGPSASLALARTGGELTEWLVLGGGVGVLLPPPGPGEEAIAKLDTRQDNVAAGLRARFRRARGRSLVTGRPRHAARAARLLRKLRAAEAAARNVPAGYWAASGEPDAALEALTGRYRTPGPVAVASAGAMPEPDDWFAWTAVGADLEAAAADLARASGDDALIVVRP